MAWSAAARFLAIPATLLFLSAAQAQTVEGFLFGPTYDAGYVPHTHGTRFDCKVYKASGKTAGWRGIVGGKTYDFDRTFNRSREGCFETRQECERFLTLMSGYIDMVFYSRCQRL